MHPDLSRDFADALIADRLREAARFRTSEIQVEEASEDAVTVRPARPSDAHAVLRLSELDGGRIPPGALLVAEVRGTVLVARSMDDGSAVADPWHPTAQLDELLALRCAQLRSTGSGGAGRRSRVRAWLRRTLQHA